MLVDSALRSGKLAQLVCACPRTRLVLQRYFSASQNESEVIAGRVRCHLLALFVRQLPLLLNLFTVDLVWEYPVIINFVSEIEFRFPALSVTLSCQV